MIKKAFQCDPLPWTILYGVIMFCLVLRILVFPLECDHASNLPIIGAQIQDSKWLQFLLKALGVIIIPFWFRKIIRRSGVLDFRERVSLYPIGLFLVTIILSCNAVNWLIIVLLNLGIFSSIVNLREEGSLNSAAFRAGILIAICSFFSPFFILLTLFVLSSLSVIRSLDWKSTLWHILGVLTPWYLGYALYFIISGSLDFHVLTDSLLTSANSSVTLSQGFAFIFYLTVLIAITLFMLHLSFGSSRTAIVRRRKFLRIGGLFFLITLAISALILQFESASPFLSLIAIPLSVIYLEMFKEGRTKAHSLLFLFWLVATFLFVWN